MDTVLILDPRDWDFTVPGKNTSNKSNNSFGQRLARFRTEAGYSQRDLAQEVGISQRMLAYYETHAQKPPLHVLPDIAEVLGVPVEVLLGAEKPAKRKRSPPVNRRLQAKMRKIEQLPKRDQQAIMRTIDAFLSKS